MDRLGGLPRRAWLTAVWTANLVLVAITIYGFFVSDAGYDWAIYVEAGRRAVDGGLYQWQGTYAWSYSPLLAFAFTALAPIGYAGWSLLHVAVLALLRDRRLMLVTALSWPFWADLYNGNTMIFVFVAAVSALRGSAIGSGAFLGLFLLMPRPLMLPLLAWILWRQPRARLVFPAAALAYAGLVLATGQGVAWFETLTGVSDAVAATSRDIGPHALLGTLWIPLGAILAVFLTLYGRVGFASLAVSPYWLPQYLLMTLLELVPHRDTASGLTTAQSPPATRTGAGDANGGAAAPKPSQSRPAPRSGWGGSGDRRST